MVVLWGGVGLFLVAVFGSLCINWYKIGVHKIENVWYNVGNN